MTRALFLDRDGILNHLVYYEEWHEWESPREPSDLRMIDGVAGPLRRIADAGWLLVIVTNQPSYAKGKIPKEALVAVHESVLRHLVEAGVPIAGSYVCFHHPEAVVEELRTRCECRKPGTKWLRDAADAFGIDLEQSWMVGDQDSDLLCGRAAGCRVALIEHEGSVDKRGSVEPDARCVSLEALATILLADQRAD
jgi:D-glycero-D-manno-heptose 1,7-bisphosphate phosphatase